LYPTQKGEKGMSFGVTGRTSHGNVSTFPQRCLFQATNFYSEPLFFSSFLNSGDVSSGLDFFSLQFSL